MHEFKLPSLGADMDKGTLIEWRVRPGDKVARGQVVAVVDTTKAAIEVECWEEGVVEELLVKPDTEIPVNTPMLWLRAADEAPADLAAWKAQHVQPVGSEAPATTAVSVSAGTVPMRTMEPMATARRRISPAARKHAAEKGIDMERVVATGPHGAVTVEDVERAAGTKPVSPTRDRAAEMRKTIAAAMARSKRDIPHYYLATEIPFAAATRWLRTENERRPVTERLLSAVLLLKAAARALQNYPELNGFYRDNRFEPATAVHFGIAISLRQGGLVAPALLDAQAKSVDQLMRALADLVKRTRTFTLRSSELSMATVTVTNLGDQGVEAVYGVIYPPQVALIGFGRIVERPYAVDGNVEALPVVTATLAADHRVSDGHRGALFLNALKALLQKPEEL